MPNRPSDSDYLSVFVQIFSLVFTVIIILIIFGLYRYIKFIIRHNNKIKKK